MRWERITVTTTPSSLVPPLIFPSPFSIFPCAWLIHTITGIRPLSCELDTKVTGVEEGGGTGSSQRRYIQGVKWGPRSRWIYHDTPSSRRQRGQGRGCLGHQWPSGALRHSGGHVPWLCSSSGADLRELQDLVHFQQMQPMDSTYVTKLNKSYPNCQIGGNR